MEKTSKKTRIIILVACVVIILISFCIKNSINVFKADEIIDKTAVSSDLDKLAINREVVDLIDDEVLLDSTTGLYSSETADIVNDTFDEDVQETTKIEDENLVDSDPLSGENLNTTSSIDELIEDGVQPQSVELEELESVNLDQIVQNLVIYNIQEKFINEEITEDQFEELSNFNDPSASSLVQFELLGEIKDINGKTIGKAYNFLIENKVEGSIGISNSSNTLLTLFFSLENKVSKKEIIFLKSESIAYKKDDILYNYVTDDKIEVAPEELQVLSEENKTDELEEVVLTENNAVLNGIVSYENEIIDDLGYSGQNVSRNKKNKNTGIYNRSSYAKSKYGGSIYFKQSSYTPYVHRNKVKGKNGCTPTAIAKLMETYREAGYSRGSLSSNFTTNFNKIDGYKDSKKKRFYSTNKGTKPSVIDNYVEKAFYSSGYKKTDSFNSYVWSTTSLKKELDKDRPLLMNMNFGYYGGHTVVVDGWSTYGKSRPGPDKVITFFRISDGWKGHAMYTDMTSFNSTGEVASFTYTRVAR